MNMNENTENTDRIRANTSQEINHQIDSEIDASVREFASKSDRKITDRINELDQEWDIERTLETNASLIALSGLVLGVTHNKNG